MGYQPRIKPSGAAKRGYRKPLHEKGKKRKRQHGIAGSFEGEKHVATTEEVTKRTLTRLHILGRQRFGSSPFSEHFDRWLMNLTDVLQEFESSPNINPDDQFAKEREQILTTIDRELEEKRRKEASIEETSKNLTNSKQLLEQIKEEHTGKLRELKEHKSREIKHLYSTINQLKRELNAVARLKTGIFRGISKKERERREIATTQELNIAQRQLELAMMDFTTTKENLRDEYEGKRQPVITSIKEDQKRIESLEADGSLEDRWFACQALVDAVNAFLQRKALQRNDPD